MSRAAVDLMRSLNLLDQRNRLGRLDRMNPATLRQKVRYYRRRRDNAIAESLATQAPRVPAALFSSVSASTMLDALLPAACAFDRIVIDDPLHELGCEPDDATLTHRKSLGMEENRDEFASIRGALVTIASMAALIEAGIVELLPLTAIRLPPDGPRPIHYSEDGFASQVPDHLRAYVQEAAVVREVRQAEGRLLVLSEPPRQPVRLISISFDGDERAFRGVTYALHESTFHNNDDGTYRMVGRLDVDDPPDREQFAAWVTQSINRTIVDRIGTLSTEMHLASRLGATYLTESGFEARLLGAPSTNANGTPAASVNFLRANMPDLVMPSPSRLVALREQEPAVFEQFQRSLRFAAAELDGVEDSEYEARAQQILHKEIQPQVEALRAALHNFSGAGVGGILTAVGALTLALATATVPFAATLIAGVTVAGGVVAPTVPAYLRARKGPAYVWSEIMRR